MDVVSPHLHRQVHCPGVVQGHAAADPSADSERCWNCSSTHMTALSDNLQLALSHTMVVITLPPAGPNTSPPQVARQPLHVKSVSHAFYCTGKYRLRYSGATYRNLGNLGLAVVICCCNCCLLLFLKGGCPANISYSRMPVLHQSTAQP